MRLLLVLPHRAHAFQASTSGAKGLSMINHSTKFNINTRLMIHLCISAAAANAAAQSSCLPSLEQRCQRPFNDQPFNQLTINTRLIIHLCISAVAAGAAAQSSRLPRLEQQCQRPVIGEHMKQFFSLFGSVCPGYGFAWPRAQIW